MRRPAPQSAGTAEALRDYLLRHPSGAHAELAQQRLDRLLAPQEQRPAPGRSRKPTGSTPPPASRCATSGESLGPTGAASSTRRASCSPSKTAAARRATRLIAFPRRQPPEPRHDKTPKGQQLAARAAVPVPRCATASSAAPARLPCRPSSPPPCRRQTACLPHRSARSPSGPDDRCSRACPADRDSCVASCR